MRTRKRKKTTRKKSGISRRLILGFLPILAFSAEPYALIAGTVYRETGHAFPGVSVKLVPLGKAKGLKRQSQTTSSRGEFYFRVPAIAMEYEVTVEIDGYRTEVKRVKIESDERIDLNFPLDRAR
ncbi:carboxypeptidase-like regulatory domain-containing protein [Oscillatoria amoena NRMC-F 0135]|nr:carboxypeptidase-like regulatory domain-containing protein [Oscillatoria amoena NRMC-F 0135]